MNVELLFYLYISMLYVNTLFEKDLCINKWNEVWLFIVILLGIVVHG